MSELLGTSYQELVEGFGQATVAVALCIAVAFACRRFSVRVERETAVSLARGFAQMVAVGAVLALLVHGTLPIAVLVLLGMAIAAGATASRRARGLSNATFLSFCAIASGAGIVITALLVTGALKSDLIVLVPVGSMIIANAMNACAQAMERYRSDVLSHRGEIETRLALGADPATTVSPFVQGAVYASLLPRLDMLKSLGLVWIPGVMAGMLVSGASPVYAGILQFIIVAMILAASGVAGLVATLLFRAQTFTPAAQLRLVPSRISPADSNVPASPRHDG